MSDTDAHDRAHDADVVVVGCGPVGVMASLRLAQRGLRVIAVDKTPDIYPLPRAIGMDDEIQRVFQNAGLIEQLRRHSTPLAGADFVDAAGARVVGYDLPEGALGACGHPPMTMFDQPAVEAFLREAALAAGVDFRFGYEAVGVASGRTATVQLLSADGHSELRSSWLVGADGASSSIRKLCGLRLEDQGFDQPWLVVDVTVLDPDVSLPRIARQHCDPERVVTFVPGPARHRRWEFRLHDHETRDQALQPDFIAALLAPWGGVDQLRVDRAAVYRFHATVIDQFRHGSVFMAGDAAHQMPPFNGQGMCTGIRDVENLTWKLAAVWAGHAGDRLLDTYHTERRPHAAGQVQHSADAGRLIDAIAAGVHTDTDAGYGGGRPFPHLESGVIDGDHPATGRQLPQPDIAGVPLDAHLGSGWALLGTKPLPADQTAWWRGIGALEVTVADGLLPGIVEGGAVCVVRPDRYVAAVTNDLDVTTARLAAHFSP